MKRILFGVLIVFLGTVELRPAVAQSDIWNCSNCGRRVWDSDSGRPRPSACPYCSGGGGSSYNAMPIPQTWGDVRNNVGQSLGNSFMQGFQQGLQNNLAAQQEAARRAAEEEKRRQEILQKAAEEARVNWEQQDAANMAAFGQILSSKKKTGNGLSPLLMKQAEQSSGVWNDPNVVDLSDTTNRIPHIPGTGAAATPFGDTLTSLGSDTGLVFQTEQLPSVWNDSSVVDLSDTTNRIPHIPGSEAVAPSRDLLPDGPIHESSLHPLAGMSDEQLEKKNAALKKSISDMHKLIEQNNQEYAEIVAEAQVGTDAAWGVLFDTGTTLAFGGLQGIAMLKDKGALQTSINLPGGSTAKKDAMREVARAAKDVKAVKDGAQGSDIIGLASTLAFNDDTGDRLVAEATVAGGAIIDSGVVKTLAEDLVIKSPIGVVPGVVKTGLDTGWVWSDYFMLKQQYERREKLEKQYNDALIHLSSDQAAVVAEQKRRKAHQ